MLKKIKNKFRNFLSDSDYRQIDWQLIIAIMLVTLFGLVMISSVGVAIGLQKHNDLYWYFKHQLISGVLPGLLGFLFFSFFERELSVCEKTTEAIHKNDTNKKTDFLIIT